MPRTPWFLLLLPLAALTTGCPEKKGDGASPSPSAVASLAPSLPSAAPSAAPRASAPAPSPTLARFPNEVAIADQKATVTFDMNVRRAPNKHDGEVLLAVRAGTEVTKIARRGQWFLVSLPDPKEPGRTVTGWVWEQAFAPPSGPGDEERLCECFKQASDAGTCEAVAGTAKGECDRTFGKDCKSLLLCARGELKPTCAAGERLLSHGSCAKVCKTNAGCRNDQICTATLGTPNVCVPAKVAE